MELNPLLKNSFVSPHQGRGLISLDNFHLSESTNFQLLVFMNFVYLELSQSFESLQKEVILFTKDSQKHFSIKIYNRAGSYKFEQDLKTVQPRILNW